MKKSGTTKAFRLFDEVLFLCGKDASFRRRLEAGLGRGRGVSDGLDVVAESGEAVGADCACGCFGSWWSGVEKG